MQEIKDENRMDWYALSVEEVLQRLGSASTGLTRDQALTRLLHAGPNKIPTPPKPSRILQFLGHFHNILIYVLLFSALIVAILQHWADVVVILAVVVINACIGFIQEGKAEQSLDAIKKMLSPVAMVLYEGVRCSIAAENLVPGDVVWLEAGDRVPADLRLIKTHGFMVDESVLTGESIAVEKHSLPVLQGEGIADRLSMAYSGTLVTAGHAYGVVVATGAQTEMGKISGLLSTVKTLKTPLLIQMDRFAWWLTCAVLAVAAALLFYGYFVGGMHFADLFMAVVGLSVAAIPEGLPAVLSITLAVGVQAMAKRHAIVRRLPAIETLGSVSVICTDKTGTLTKNEMTVVNVLTASHCFEVEGVGYAPLGRVKEGGRAIERSKFPALLRLVEVALLCNDATLLHRDGMWSTTGDPMEAALLSLAHKMDAFVLDEQKKWARRDVIPFDARHRLMATLCHHHMGRAYILVKGAPEKIVSLCQTQLNAEGQPEPIDEAYWMRQCESIAEKGQRVLAFAFKEVSYDMQDLKLSSLEEGLILAGMAGLIDPPREEAIDAVRLCLAAGIDVKMITGDHQVTARAIGRQMGLRSPDAVLTGAELEKMTDEQLYDAVLHYDIYARTSPEHKLRLVMALQSHDKIVAMTGDGVNDALALKRADIGIAMGHKGNEVSKEAAEFILTDDNFASIVAAVQEGRTVYDNLKKVIGWTLPTNAGEAMTIVLALLLGLNLPVTPMQILWVNLITAVTLGLALAFEPTEEGTMNRPPRNRGEPLLSRALIWHIVLVSSLFVLIVFGVFYYTERVHGSLILARTMALNTLVVLEVFHLFFIRNLYCTSLTFEAIKGTKTIWMTLAIIVFCQLSVTYFPLMQRVFETQSIPLMDGVLIIGLGVCFFIILEFEKQFRLRFF